MVEVGQTQAERLSSKGKWSASHTTEGSSGLSREVGLNQEMLILGAPAVYLKGFYPPMGHANLATHLRPQEKEIKGLLGESPGWSCS